jgi:beta-galactosidase
MLQLVVGCQATNVTRERISINHGWRFMKYAPDEKVDELIYDVRPEVRRRRQIIMGKDEATAAVEVEADDQKGTKSVVQTSN